jgi:aryl-alcohol dehydrogenase-like predicted oxidoreductase
MDYIHLGRTGLLVSRLCLGISKHCQGLHIGAFPATARSGAPPRAGSR